MARYPNISRTIRINIMNELPSIDEAVMEGDARHAMDHLLRVEFYAGAVQNAAKSEEAGFPVFDDADFVRINIPGDVKSSYEAVVDLSHKRRFARQWAAYQAGQSQETTGMSLDKLPGMTLSLKASLVARGIITVEQLASLSDQLATGLMGIHELRRKAIALVEVAKGAEGKQFVQTELSKRDAQIEALKAQMAELLKPKVEVKKAA